MIYSRYIAGPYLKLLKYLEMRLKSVNDGRMSSEPNY